MKRLITILFACLILLSLSACDSIVESDSENPARIEYTYDDVGRVIKEQHYDFTYVINDSGWYKLSKTLEFDYDENGNLKEKRFFDEYFEGRKSQTHKYTYNTAGLCLREEIYNHEKELVSTNTYTYDENGKLLAKETCHIKLHILDHYIYVGAKKTAVYQYWVGYIYDDLYYHDMVSYVGNELFADTELDENATYKIHYTYYPNGTEKTRSEYIGDTLLKYIEFDEVGELESKTMQVWRSPMEKVWGGNAIVEIMGEEECLCEVGGIRYYKHCGDGTLDTQSLAAADFYLYYKSGALNLKASYDVDQNGVIEEYYESGAKLSRYETTYDADTTYGVAAEKGESWYESGALKSRWDVVYKPDGKNYSFAYIEEFYESGAKKSLTEVDIEKGIDTYTQWDETGKEIPTEVK